MTYFQQLSIGLAIAIALVFDGHHRGKDSEKEVDAENHEDSQRGSGF